MNCPHCNTHIDEHPASRCLDAWVAAAIFDIKVVRYELGEYELPLYRYANGNINSDTIGHYSTSIAAAKQASDKAGSTVIFAPRASVRDGCYANRKKDWLVEIIPHGGTTEDAVWAYGKTEELARCRAAIKANSAT